LPERGSLDARPVPDWYTDAKLGIFVHWGLYSIPAFAEPTGGDYTTFIRDLTAGKDTRGRIPYAEWYLNALRVPGSPTARHHQATYGTDFSYFDFQAPFDQGAANVDFARWAQLFARAGARYVVMVTRHLDGYPLWPTSVANPHMPPGYRSRRDLVRDLTGAVRAVELIDAYRPSVLWNDVGWPAESDPHRVMAHYYNTVADGVVNDRWTQVRVPANRLVRGLYLRFVTLALKALARSGRSLPQRRPSFHSDFQTHEYATPDPAPTSPWSSVAALAAPSGTTPRRPPPTPSPAPSWSICWPMSSPTAATC
jgi:alpha-L-fucosidase